MLINIKGKEKELKFTFNSFRFMQNFNLGELDEMEKNPFKIINIVETLMVGALNNDPKDKYSLADVDTFLEWYMEDNSLPELLENLMSLLQESSFFKSLQKETNQK